MGNNKNQEFSLKDESLQSIVTENAPYISPTPGEIPIIACSPFNPNKVVVRDDNTPEEAELLTKADITPVVECGFNVGMLSVSRYEGVMNAYLELFKGTNLGFMPTVGDYFRPTEGITEATAVSYINNFKNSSEIVGWDFVDEPLYTQLEWLKVRYNRLRQVDPNHMFYINLIGGPAEKCLGNYGEKTNDEAYWDYLTEIQNIFKPGVWSYDLYPIRKSATGEITVNTYSFYRDLEYFLEISKRTDRPFWAYCQSQAYHLTTDLAGCPAPEEEYLRYEAFSALAYGAQGIVYWTYAQRRNNDEEIYTTALYGSLGDGIYGKTKYWYYAKKVNQEIKKFTKVFLGCSVDRVVRVKAGILNENRVNFFGPLKYGQAESESAVFSSLFNGNDAYIVIVNGSPLNNCMLSLQFNERCSMAIWNPDTSKEAIDAGILTSPNTQPVGFYLKPGGYLIIKYRAGLPSFPI